MKKYIVICVALCMALVLSACGQAEDAVYVQPVTELINMGGIAPGDRFPGIVVSENISQIQKDNTMTVAELFVREGDDVVQGQELFAYDTQQLQLALDKQKLELQQLQASIENFEDQIKDLEKDRKKAKESDKLAYTVQIQSLQVDLKEAQINISAKESAVEQSSQILENSVVYAPVDGRIQSVSESGTDNYGNPLAYITIQQTGAYRVKGTIGELQRGVIMEGTRLQILSRTDGSLSWGGTVTLVDYESPTQENPNGMYFGTNSDEMSTSSKYPFYVELDDTQGLLLGQHVYLQLENQEAEATGICISSAFICYAEDGSSYVWADDRGKLQQRPVTLGEYNMMNDTYPITAGLSEEDYLAFPDGELCVEGAPTTQVKPEEKNAESGVA